MKFFSILTLGILISSLSACSNNATSNTTKNSTTNNSASTITNHPSQLGKQRKVELGTILAIKTVQLKNNTSNTRPYGNIGVSVGSGGHSGVFGSVDVATIGRLFSRINKAKTAQEIIIRKNNGETIAITQASNERFSIGDKVKILLRNNQAVVIH